MKRMILNLTACIAAVMYFTGCAYTPPAIKDPNATGKPVPIPAFATDIILFDYQAVPLSVAVNNAFSTDEAALAATLKGLLQQTDVNCVAPGTPSDIQINVKSEFEELTPAPNCRLSHTLSVAVASSKGAVLSASWQHKTDSLNAYSTLAQAKNKMMPQINKNLKFWEANKFRTSSGTIFKATILRFRTSSPLIEVNPFTFEEDIRKITNKLNTIPGVIEVRMIESDKADKLASFRVIHDSKTAILAEVNK